MRYIVSALITAYQRFVSPYKGFRCAYGVYHGGRSCSAIVKRIVLAEGLVGGWSAILDQFRQCRCAYKLLSETSGADPNKPEEAEEGENEEDGKKKGKRTGLCPEAMAATCCVPDPSDCTIGSVAQGACGGVADAVGGVCSCF